MNNNVEWHKAVRPVTDIGPAYVDGNGDLIFWSSVEAVRASAYLSAEAVMDLMPVASLKELRAKAEASNDDHLRLNGYGALAQRVAVSLGYALPMGLRASLRAVELSADKLGEDNVLSIVNSWKFRRRPKNL